MGVVSDLVGNVGHMFGIGGGMNQFHANAPTNSFQASPYNVDFASAIKQAMTNAGGISGQQQGLVQALQSQAAGNGPSLAQPLLQQATDQNTQQSAGMIASQRGMNAGNAQRQIADQRAGIQQQGAQQMALLRNQEQLGAQGMLGNVLGQMGQQNLGMFGTAGALGSANYNAAQGLNANVAGQNAQLQQGAQQINAGVAQQNAGITAGAIGGALGGLGGALGMGAMGGGGAGGGLSVDSAWQGINAAGGLPTEGLGIAGGGEIPGSAPVAGDDEENDIVPAQLSPGEIVLPRSVAQADNAPELAAEFVRAVRRKHYAQGGVAGYAAGGKVPAEGYGKVLAIAKEHEKRLKLVESKLMSKRESKKVDRYAEGKK